MVSTPPSLTPGTPRMLVLLCFVGLLVGGQLNRAIYRWAWNPRQISPWSAPPEGAAPRTWTDCIPVVGWWPLRRESELHGKAFWVRPMFLELACAIGLPALYWWEVQGDRMTSVAFLAHAVLFWLMLVATFIDIDEKTIPDFVTIPGTLIALTWVVVTRGQSLLPGMVEPATDPVVLSNSLVDWSPSLNGMSGLLLGLFCWFGWCYGLLPKTIYFRGGIAKGIRFLVASIVRDKWSAWIGGMGAIGVCLIAAVWALGQFGGQPLPWQSLLSSLVGLAFGGGIVWAIRIVAGYVLGVEAMGFGDVTLMAMIGAFLGWQAALMTFFLAPFTSIVIAVTQWVMTGRRDIPFGPFLCAAAAIVIIQWDIFWIQWKPVFALGLLVPMIIAVCVVLMGVMLAILQVIKRLIGVA